MMARMSDSRPPRLTFRPAASCAPATLARLFNAAYRDYAVPMELTPATLEAMVRMFSLDLELSRVGFERRRLVALALLGVRDTRAWVAGVGVRPDARGRGHGAAVTQAVVEAAAAGGATEVWLEVLDSNHTARRIYERAGFAIVRRLGVWVRPPNEAARRSGPLAPVAVADVDAAAACVFMAAARRGLPPWQRDMQTLEGALPFSRGLLASCAGQPVAALLYSAARTSVDVLEVAALEDDPDRAAERALLGELCGRFPAATIRMVNFAADDILVPLFEEQGARPMWWQHEMRLQLPAHGRVSA